MLKKIFGMCPKCGCAKLHIPSGHCMACGYVKPKRKPRGSR